MVLTIGKDNNAWAGLFNPVDSRVNLRLYFWEVSNIGQSPVRARIYFNSCPHGQRSLANTVFQGNTKLYLPSKPRIRLYQASGVAGEPEGGVKVFVRRALIRKIFDSRKSCSKTAYTVLNRFVSLSQPCLFWD
ncbi:MAG: DUF6143 family protein [Anaerotignum sp.]|nr:DUF6143 family protein [Anaerotignum sp.]